MNLGEIDKYGFFIPRQVGCNKCKFCENCDFDNTSDAKYCDDFEPSQPQQLVCGADGIPVRSLTGLDYRTKSQWEHITRDYSRRVKFTATGVAMKQRESSKETTIYYSLEDTEEWPDTTVVTEHEERRTCSTPLSEKKGNRILRSFSCGQCIFGGGVMEWEHHVDCQKRSYRPHVSAAETCEDFKHRLAEYPQSIDTIQKSEYDGLPIRSKTAMDFRTEKQWLAAGFQVKPGEEGYEMHPAFLSKRTCIYYLPEQVY